MQAAESAPLLSGRNPEKERKKGQGGQNDPFAPKQEEVIPECTYKGHGLFGIDALFPAGVRKERFTISVDNYSNASRNFVRICGDFVHEGPDAIFG